MNPPKSPTPRTDAQAGWSIANQYGQSTGSELLGDPDGVFVHAVFARTLERELAAVQAECLEQARLLGISGSREASLIARAEKAEIELADAKAEAENQTKWSLKYLDRANKAEARLEFLIVHGGDYVGWAETWNVSIEDLDADMAAEIKL